MGKHLWFQKMVPVSIMLLRQLSHLDTQHTVKFGLFAKTSSGDTDFWTSWCRQWGEFSIRDIIVFSWVSPLLDLTYNIFINLVPFHFIHENICASESSDQVIPATYLSVYRVQMGNYD